MTDLPSPEELRRLLQLDPESGQLTWRTRPVEMFSGQRLCTAWNNRFAGKPAFATRHGAGYMTGRIHRRALLAHRVIWALVHGEWPAEDIDHVDGDQANNRLSNLRSVSHAVNSRNRKRPKSNTSGACGVYLLRSGRWNAKFQFAGKQIGVGTFDTKEEAIAARLLHTTEYGFHANHGSAR